MKRFTELFIAIDQTTKTNAKVNAIVNYLENSDDRTALYAIALLIGNRPRRPVKTADLKGWAASAAGIPSWLFEASYHVVGDLAEAIALVLPPQAEPGQAFTLPQVVDELANLSKRTDEEKKASITCYWKRLDKDERFVFTKLITGNFRMGVSRQLVIKALATYLGM